MNILLITGLIFSPVLFTDNFINYSASILSGETVPDCPECSKLIACTILYDAQKRIERGYSPYTLYPNRWHGWNPPTKNSIQIIEEMLSSNCIDMPKCRYMGNYNDYIYWLNTYNNIENVNSIIVGNSRGIVVCVPYIKSEHIPVPSWVDIKVENYYNSM